MKCKLTGTEGKGINAHIIPKSFYAIDPEETKPTKLITNAKGQYSKRCQIGIYDDTIVTEEGERVFSDWDNYASDLLLKGKSVFEPITNNGSKLAFQITDYDYKKLKLFFLSVLWRASVSSQHFFRNVNLGPYEAKVREALLTKDPKDTDWLAVCIARWSDSPDAAGMMDPYSTRFDGIKYYVVYLEHYIVYYKVDKQIPDETFRAIQLKPNAPLIAIARQLSKSKELKIMVNIAKTHAKKAKRA